ncbi:hypothetical protein HaLaN_25284 [Haematococcus lacustris]|uniref:Uncharacterized protein n=1 Tax=Haematococcus lacustris TaxID=44745 RepID=A0A6A0A4B4_HAELA|nr:hypothetical protein HaLaN_25284 [Haematococcus lacustris]
MSIVSLHRPISLWSRKVRAGAARPTAVRSVPPGPVPCSSTDPAEPKSGGCSKADSSTGISRQDIAAAFAVHPPGYNSGGGERVLNISELLASCPDDLIWTEDDDDSDPSNN